MKIKLRDILVYCFIFTTGMTIYFFVFVKWNFSKSLIFAAVISVFAAFASIWFAKILKKKK